MARTTTSRPSNLSRLNLRATLPTLSGRDNTVYCYNDVLWSRKSANTKILQKSTDSGQTWNDVFTFTYNISIVIVTPSGNILVGQKSDDDIYADPPAQLYLSTNGGSSFSSVLTLSSGGFGSWSYDLYGETVFVAGYGKYNGLYVYRSVDGGATWTTVFTHPVDGSSTVHIHKIHIDNVTPTTIYVSAGDSSPAKGVWCSPNNGASWSVITRSHQPTWMESDKDYLYLGEDLEGDIHRIAKSRLGEGDQAIELSWSAESDPRGTYANLSFYSGGRDSFGNIYFGGVAYGENHSSNNREAVLVVSPNQGQDWIVIKSYGRYPNGSSGPAVLSRINSAGIIHIKTNLPNTVERLDTNAINALLASKLNRLASLRTRSQNLLFNGDFEFTPGSLTTGTNVVQRWIDGSASGSSANTAYGWAIPSGGYASSAEAAFDPSTKVNGNYSMRLSNLSTTGAITVSSFRNTTTNFYTPVLPNTAYTLSAWVKSNNVPPNGAYLDLRQFTSTGATVLTTSTTKLSGTNEWTQITLNVVTDPTTRLCAVFLRCNVVGNICDAWFDSVVLAPTTPITRNIA